ncbi:MAG: acyltransferase domain-containing protein [Calditrichaeota bacterium]|nr:MAG: acyltransferase domain-containing protein [Calditrichota bacterium]MBL1204438.1 acyltransferase domain-containing protein [Calditrichota bacterium]NOG44267.1 acyltransferase domain-containing protein [Calditrichota bacterium]
MPDHINMELDIAVVGLAGRFPGAKNIDEFWQLLKSGKEGVTHFSEEELIEAGISEEVLKDPNYIKTRGIIENADLFDAYFFDMSPHEAEIMDPQQRVFLETCWQALENSGYNPDKYPGLIGLFAGVSMNTYLFSILNSKKGQLGPAEGYQLAIGNDKDFLTTRASYKMNLRGPSVDIQTACSTSLVAIHMACQNLQNFSCDMALAGGVSITIPQKQGYLYQEGMILSKNGECRAFDADSSGTISGSGAGIVVLKRVEDAINDGDTIHALIKGSAYNNDGSMRVGYTAPSVDGQADVIATAQAIAGVDPQDISYIEAHGTGTELGDPIEITALNQVFSAAETDKKQYCGIGSVKTNIGHLDAAAGVAGFIKTVLSLKNKQIPASLHFEKPNPKIDFANSPFYVNNKLKEWQSNGFPLTAGISSFGIGGTNAHVVLQEMPKSEKSTADDAPQLLLFSAKTRDALKENCQQIGNFLTSAPDTNLADVAYTLDEGRKHFNLRRYFVAENKNDAIEVLQENNLKRIFETVHKKDPAEPQVTFMFSGQGSQYAQMAKEIYDTKALFKECVDHCAEILKPVISKDIRDIIFTADKDSSEINETQFTQPALFIIEYALAKLWIELGIAPAAMVGHSIGEYVAACLAGVFSLEDALKIVAERGRLMQSMPVGAMLSVSLDEHDLKPHMTNELSIAALNSKGSSVVSGTFESIEKLELVLKEKSIESRKLHTSHAFHSKMMEPILDNFKQFVAGFDLNTPEIPYVSNVSGGWITADEATDPAYYAKHLRSTVRFADNISTLFENEESIFLEVGPGKTLVSLATRHPENSLNRIILSSLRHPQDEQSDRSFLLNTMGRLWLAGVQFNNEKRFENKQIKRIPLPTYSFDRKQFWYGETGQIVQTTDDENKRQNTNQWLYTPSWKQADFTFKQNLETDKTWLVFSSDDLISAEIEKKLAANKINAVFVKTGSKFSVINENHFELNPSSWEDYKSLFTNLQQESKIPDKILHLWSCSEKESSDILTLHETGFFSLTNLAAAIEQIVPQKEIQLFVLTNGLQEISGDEQLKADNAPILGPCRVIPQELSNITSKSIDLSGNYQKQSDLYAEFILQESTRPVDEYSIAYRGTHRWLGYYDEVKPTTTDELLLKQNGTYLITGGLGRIGLTFAKYLANNYNANLILVNRSTVPEQNEWKNYYQNNEKDLVWYRIDQLLEIEKTAQSVKIFSIDAANENEMKKVIDFAKSKLNGVIHAAGTLGESMVGLVSQVSRDDLATQLHSKLEATKVLDKVLSGKNLDFVILQSSLSTVLGGLGFTAYSAANHFLDVFCQAKQSDGQNWLCVNWDGWRFEGKDGTKVSTNVTDYSIYPDEGVEVLTKILGGIISRRVIVSTGNLETRINKWLIGSGPVAEDDETFDPSQAKHDRPNLPTPFVEPETDLQKEICSTWQRLLGIAEIGINDDFFDLGGNSLLGTQLIAQLRQKFQVELPIRVLFEDPTISGVAKVIGEQKEDIAPQEDLLADMLNKVESMSEEQIKEMLKKKN